MLGDKLGKATGKVTSRRVLDVEAGTPTVETTYEASGKLLGVDAQEMGTYESSLRPDGTLFGHGNGVLMGKGGEMATWTGSGVGTFRKDGGVNYRGAIYYFSTHPRWSRLNGVAAVYEYTVDGKGRSKADIWEWK